MSKPKLTKMQEMAVLHGKGNALVSASAGSGKTHVVIERIIRLIIEEKIPVKKVLAVTFTKLAAEEMKEKLKSALTKKYLETKDKRLKEELDSVNASDISTIDSFCSKLIKKYFYVIGVDSNFQVLEEGKKKRLSETAMDELFEKLYESGDEEFLKLISIFATNRSDKGLKEAILKLYAFSERANGLDELYKKTEDTHLFVHEYLTGEYAQTIKDIANSFGFEFSTLASSFKEDEQRRAFAENLSSVLRVMGETIDYFAFFNEFKKLGFTLPRTKSKEPDYAEILSATFKKFKERIKNIEAVFAVDKEEDGKNVKNSFKILQGLFNLTKKYEEALCELKAEENAVDFADIEKYALKLLSIDEIREEVVNSYDYVFIDEYQDVNDIQEQIINKVTKNNAFLVGDSKQSIYAFRGCNPEYFSNKYRLYESGEGTAIPLDFNFRSAPSVVNGVNAIFKGVMTDGYGGTDYSKNPMLYGNGYGDYEGRCEIHVALKPEKTEIETPERGVYSVMHSLEKKQEEDVSSEVKLILEIINERLGKEYYDLKSGGYRKIGFSDICILLRSIGGEAKLGEELVHTLVKAGVPISSSVKKSVKDYPEIQVLLNLLHLLVNAERDVPLATVMLNLCNFSEDELADIKRDSKLGRDASFYSAVEAIAKTDSSLSKKCESFLKWLQEKRLIAEFLPVGELFNSIIKETGYLAKISASKYGEARLRRVERFIAESIVGGKKLRANEFESHIEDVLEDIAIGESLGEDTVKIMTMHASKGLEFPVVIVAGVNKKFSGRDKVGSVIYEKESGVGVKSYDSAEMKVYENSVRSLIKARLDRSTQVEELRLFYVALTRAKCELYILTSSDEVKVSFDKNSVSSMTDFLSAGDIPVFYHEASELTLEYKNLGESVAGKEVDLLLTEKIVNNLSYVYPYNNVVNLPVKTSVSDVNKAGDEEYYLRTDKFGSSSSEKGTAYHRFFELIDFYDEVNSELLNSFVKSGLMEKKQAEFIDIDKVKRILGLEIFKRLRGKKLLKEQKFCHLVSASELYDTPSTEKILVQGIADLIAIDGDGAILIDYKISTIESDEDIVKAYKTQMHLYKNAIENVLGLKVKQVIIVNVLQEKVIEVV